MGVETRTDSGSCRGCLVSTPWRSTSETQSSRVSQDQRVLPGTSGVLDLWTREGVLEQNVLQKDPCDTSFGTGQADESEKISSTYSQHEKELLRGTFNRRRSSAAFQKTRRYYEGLSPQQKEEFWSRVRSGNKADEESYKHQMSIG